MAEFDEEKELPGKMEVVIKLMFFVVSVLLLMTEISEELGVCLSMIGSAYFVWVLNDFKKLRRARESEK